MSIRNLEFLFDPASVAVIGASDRPGSVGATVWRNLRDGGFKGRIYAVNPGHKEIDGVAVFGTVDKLPEAPELAVICTPPGSVPGLVGQLGRRGTRAAIVVTYGLDAAQTQAMLDAARPHLLRLLGPNGLGLLAPHIGLDASVAPTGAKPGALAFVSQSGALVTAMLDWAQGRGIGFSQVVSLGGHADIDFGDLLDFLGTDPKTRSILLYIESLQSARKFMSAARAAARNKPVIVVKTGRSEAGRLAARSHGASMTGSDAVFDAAIRRAGMLRVDTLQDLFMAAETLSRYRAVPPPPGDPVTDEQRQLARLTIVTNCGGAGVLAADAAALAGVALAEPDAALTAAPGAQLPPNGTHGNPVEMAGNAPVQHYVDTLGALLASPQAGTLLFMHAPSAVVPSAQIAGALLPLVAPAAQRVLSCWLGDKSVAEARRAFHDAGIASHDTPEEAVRAFSMLQTYRRNQELLLEAPPAAAGRQAPDIAAVRAVVTRVLDEGREWLSESEARLVLTACGIPIAATRRAANRPAALLAAARAIGFPVALKLVSPDIVHKTDVGGVTLDLEDEAALKDARRLMLQQVKHKRPEARIEGFSVQAMVRRPQAQELIVGASIDPLFGPVIRFGQGGTAAEVLADSALALPPLNGPLARALVASTRVSRLLQGWREVPPADLGALVAVLTAVSHLMAEVPQIAELDINPLLLDAQGIVALDARLRVSATAPGGAARFAIRPYPSDLVETLDWRGRRVTVRPVRPEDEAQHRAFLEKIDPEDIRMRIFYSRRTIERSELARLTQIDYEREMALLATATDADGREETLAVVRAVANPDNTAAEFGIIVRSDMKGAGLGRLLLGRLIEYQRRHGTQRLVATVLNENTGMLKLARGFGFVMDETEASAGTLDMHLDLQAKV